jgi:hypothetical protein
VKEALLGGGKVNAHVEIPLTASGPRPTVIALIGDPHRYLGAGFVAVR